MGLKRRLPAIAAIAAALAGSIYVGQSGMTVAKQEEEPVNDGKETIYFWYSDETLADFIGSAAVAFGQERDVRIIPILTSDSQYLEALNEASLYSEQIPDAYIISNDSLEKAYLAGLASKITEEEMVLSAYPQAAVCAVTYHDKLVAYPYYYETSAFLYNKTYLEAWTAEQLAAQEETDDFDEAGEEDMEGAEPVEEDIDGEEEIIDEESLVVTPEQIAAGIPSTMDEVLAFADNYDASENGEDILSWDVSDVFYNYYFVGNYMTVGGECGDDDTNIDIYNEETKQCLEIYQQLNQFFYIDPEEVSYEDIIEDFIEGKLVFTVATTDVLKKLEAAGEEGRFAYEYGIATIPKPDKNLAGRSLSVTSCIVVNGYSEHKALANEFAAFLTGEYYEKLYDRTGKVSANLSANQDNEYLQVFMEEYKNSKALPKMIETSNFWIQLEVLFARVWNGEDIDKLLSDLDAQIVSQIQ